MKFMKGNLKKAFATGAAAALFIIFAAGAALAGPPGGPGGPGGMPMGPGPVRLNPSMPIMGGPGGPGGPGPGGHLPNFGPPRYIGGPGPFYGPRWNRYHDNNGGNLALGILGGMILGGIISNNN